MSVEIRTRIDDKAFRRAFLLAPVAMTRHVDRGVGRAGELVARQARREAPKAFTTLTQSIRASRVSAFKRTVAPGVDYAEIVERGAGPGGTPSWATLAEWIRVKRIMPRDITMDEADLTFLIGQKIHRQGTPAQPYMAPAAEKTRDEVTRVIQTAVRDGLRTVGLL